MQDMIVGQLQSTLQCPDCGTCSHTFDEFLDFSLPLPCKSSPSSVCTIQVSDAVLNSIKAHTSCLYCSWRSYCCVLCVRQVRQSMHRVEFLQTAQLCPISMLTGVPGDFCTDRNTDIQKCLQLPCVQVQGACHQTAVALPVPQSASHPPEELQRSEGDM